MDKLKVDRIKLSEYSEEICRLLQQLHPGIIMSDIKRLAQEMFAFSNYMCFGIFNENSKLLGICGCWTTVKIYSGKQLEVDNVVVDNSLQSAGYGKCLFEFIDAYAVKNNYKTIELNTFVTNSRSHKFYFNQGFNIKGYHFQKHLIL